VVAGDSDYDAWALKLYPDDLVDPENSGEIEWQKTYGNSELEVFYDVQMTSDGGYIVTGEKGNDVWVLKLNADGTVTWQKRYDGEGTGLDAGRSVRQTDDDGDGDNDDGFIVAGNTYSFFYIPGSQDMWLIKLDDAGNVVWEKTYLGYMEESRHDDYASAVRQTPNGEYVVAGWTASYGDGNQSYPDYWVLKVDAAGDLPGCAAIGIGGPAPSNTAVPVLDSNAFVLKTGALSSVTNVSPIIPSIATSTVCNNLVPSRAEFLATTRTGIVPFAAHFMDLSVGNFDTWAWDFDNDGIIDSTEQNPFHTYYTVGGYTVSLTASGPDGSDIETKADYIQVVKAVDFVAAPRAGGTPMQVWFVNNSMGDFTEWFWDFGDGRTNQTENPSHVYWNSGAYTVSLTGTGPGGEETETKVDYILVGVEPDTPLITKVKHSGEVEPGGVIALVGYFFGDSQGDSEVHIGGKTYGPGSSNIKLWTDRKIRVKIPNYTCDSFNGETEKTRKASVVVNGTVSNKMSFTIIKPDPCVAFSATPTSGSGPLVVNFTDESESSQVIQAWAWDFDGDTIFDSLEQHPGFTYTDPGDYTVSLTVTSPAGTNTRIESKFITVEPAARFSASPKSGTAPLTVTFTDNTVGTVDTWSWDFDNDGTEDSTEQNPSYSFNLPGTYTVTLTVTGPGGTDVKTRQDLIGVSF
jgi:PKD repeat protein